MENVQTSLMLFTGVITLITDPFGMITVDFLHHCNAQYGQLPYLIKYAN